jgi:DNA-directed RNA polymerase specialized sigma24 family protein
MEKSVSLTSAGEREVDVVDTRAELETLVIARMELRRVQALFRELTPDQRLVLISQVALGMPRAEFCSRYSWSPEKYRKVAQRARARLGRLMSGEETDVPAPPGRSDEGTGTNL